jgi:hypothetical protein
VAVGIAAKSTSLKDQDEAPPLDFPEGGVSLTQRWTLLCPATIAEEDLDAEGREGQLAAGLRVMAGVGLVGMGEASRWVDSRGWGGGDEKAISCISAQVDFNGRI